MKRIILIAVAALMLTTGSARAAGGRQNRAYRSSSGNGPISRLVELERRKNAWLRQTFLGR